MSTVSTCWLKDKNGEKVAPKTLASQIVTSDGTSYDVAMQSRLDELNANKVDNATLDNYYNKTQIDGIDLISLSDIDVICGISN